MVGDPKGSFPEPPGVVGAVPAHWDCMDGFKASSQPNHTGNFLQSWAVNEWILHNNNSKIVQIPAQRDGNR